METDEHICAADVPGLVEQYQGKLLRYALLFQGRQAAEDAIQDAWVQLLRLLGEGKPPMSAKVQAWLSAVVRNRLIDVARHEGLHPLIPLEDLCGWEPLREGWEAEVDEHLLLETVLAQMTVYFREALLLKQDGYSIFEIAFETGAEPGNVKVRLMRARRQAAALYEKESA